MPQSKGHFRLGILGGMGPRATIYFEQLLLDLTDARSDQDHLDVVTHNNSAIPDRTQSLAQDGGRSLAEALADSARLLEKAGASAIVIPCNTAHSQVDKLARQIKTPIIHLIKLAAESITKEQAPVAILATDGTITARLYQGFLEQQGIPYVLPDSGEQRVIMDIIYRVKSGELPTDSFNEFITRCKQAGARSCILGCSELSLLGSKVVPTRLTLVDPLEVAARYIIRLAGKQVRSI